MKYKAIAFDMDGIFFPDKNFWIELHKAFGTETEGKLLTEKLLANGASYAQLVEEVVVKLWKGKNADPYFALVNDSPYLPGVQEFMAYVNGLVEKGVHTALITGSARHVAERVQRDYGIQHIYANHLVIEDNAVAGTFVGQVQAGHEKKVECMMHLCEELNITPDQVIYIGDTRRDKEVMEAAGYAIGFNVTDQKDIAALEGTVDDFVGSHDLKDLLVVLKKLYE